MNPKIEITKKILEILSPNYNDKEFKKSLHSWWLNWRQKDKGGLRLTELGFEAFIKANIKSYFVKFEQKPIYNNQFVVDLDNLLECPFYIENKGIHVFNEKIAVQLVLLSGNIKQYTSIKANKVLN